jgi:hypothetical protein
LKLTTKSTKSRDTIPKLVETRDKMPKKDKKVYCFKTNGYIAFTTLLVVKEISFGVLDLLRVPSL